VHKWVVEQWRDGEIIRRLEFTDTMIQQEADGSVVITFPAGELAGGFILSTGDTLRLCESNDG